MDIEQFVDTVNNLRKTNKDKWYTFSGTVNDKAVEIKGFNTWLQIFRVNGIKLNAICDIPVKKFLDELRRGVV